MPKWVGGIFGNTIASTATGTNVKGVFNSQDQYYMKQEGGWSYVTYSVSPSTASVNEGSSVTFTTTTTNVPDGTTLYWTLNTVSGTVNASDFSGGATSGSFTITGGSGSVVLTLANDATTEGSESFQLQVRTGSTGGTIVATSSTVTINDTSLSQISATGGTVIDSGGFRIHVFTSPGSFVVSNAGPGTVEYLVVAGGGGGGFDGAGGGGAGGFRSASGFPVTVTTYPISIGAGGPAAVATPGFGGSGNPSTFSTITSAGGGGGGSKQTGGVSGGSGGGSGHGSLSGGGSGNTPPTSPPQGNPGGNNGGPSNGGGGGGASAAGSPTKPGGDGSPITWIPASYGTPGPAPGRYFAGGGGGGDWNGVGGSGGAGGGGNGGSSSPSVGTPGTTNTGGGGGSNGNAGGSPNAVGSGGSGIVAIRYPYV